VEKGANHQHGRHDWRSMIRKAVGKVVEVSGERPWTILAIALLSIMACALVASRLELRTELRELLPRDSPDYQAYEKQAGRIGGGATLFVIAESSDRRQNERFIDAVADRLARWRAERQACRAACQSDSCRRSCGEDLVRYVESNSRDVRAFFDAHGWLYASLEDLVSADEELNLRIATGIGLVEDLETDDREARTQPKAAAAGDRTTDRRPPQRSLATQAREFERSLVKKLGDYPSGYFTTPDGRLIGLKMVSRTGGMGDQQGKQLLEEVKRLVSELGPKSFAPDLEVGFAGDIPNAVEEQQSLASEALWVTSLAALLILGGVVVFYRSPWSLVIIGFPVLFGASVGYAFASLAYGYVNTVGAFLGAIIIGNGINYPIVLLSRYRDFRAREMPPDVARREAVFNALRAELVGAGVAAIAYGSLTITRFRGFSQFGTIGFVGMLAVWISIIPLVPALVVLVERLQHRLPRWLRDPELRLTEDGSSGRVVSHLSRWVARYPVPILGIAAAATVVAIVRLPAYLEDPWEYDFSRLGSAQTQSVGAGAWSTKADRVFGGRTNVGGAMMVADSPEQVPLIKQQILAKDLASPQGKVVESVVTIHDLLPGEPEEQRAKLAVLERIRRRLTPRVLSELQPGEREHAQKLKDREKLGEVGPNDLPPLLKRRFQENDGKLGTVYYVQYKNDLSLSDGRNLLRMAAITENVQLPDGTQVLTASRPGVFAEMIRSMAHDGPLATLVSFSAVAVVVVLATGSWVGAMTVLLVLCMGVLWMVGAMTLFDVKLNFLNFIALPITFGIGCEYPFNLFDRARLLGGDVSLAVRRSAGPVALCSYTTLLGYGSLVFADNQALQSFGRVAASGELSCTAAALVVLPCLLHLMNRSERLRARWPRGWRPRERVVA
jgi:predicted RND superfamily exporter protein